MPFTEVKPAFLGLEMKSRHLKPGNFVTLKKGKRGEMAVWGKVIDSDTLKVSADSNKHTLLISGNTFTPYSFWFGELEYERTIFSSPREIEVPEAPNAVVLRQESVALKSKPNERISPKHNIGIRSMIIYTGE